MRSPWDDRAEWLESDGLGGFASGTVSGVRTRRYHALLLTALSPPTRRFVLVNGFDAWVETGSGTTMFTAQRYAPDVLAPDHTARHVEYFEPEPWPRWVFRLPDGSRLIEELFVRHGSSNVVLHWTHEGAHGPARLFVRPFLSGRDYHSLHRENGAFRFLPEVQGERIAWRPYPGLPAILALTNGRYRHEPHWYRNFEYDRERERGLDCVEDLAAPGVIEFDLSRRRAVLILAAEGHGEQDVFSLGTAVESAVRLRELEKERRMRIPSRLHRAADAYIVRRGNGKTIVAGYPWFTDWGRDAFIALRGLCTASGRSGDARDILLSWCDHVSEGMLPNRFPDAGEQPEYNSVDASLWYVVAVHDWLNYSSARGETIRPADRKRLADAVLAILEGYARGTRFGIHMAADGLLACGQPGTQLTWMDAKIGDWVVTPRIGKPVEVQALWINALRIGAEFDPKWHGRYEAAREAFSARFWNDAAGCLYDVVDVDHKPGENDGRVRPNQVFAVGGLPYAVLDGERAARVVYVVEQRLWTPLGLRTLAPDEPGYAAHYVGGPQQRDAVYHQGPAWPWLLGAFVEAWLRVKGNGPERRREARERFLRPLLDHIDQFGLGHMPELVDAAPPWTPRGCPFQAWSLGEVLRLEQRVLAGADAESTGVAMGADAQPESVVAGS